MELNLATERLLLRPVTLSDVDLAVEMFTDPAVVKHIGKLMTPDEVTDKMPEWVRRGGDGCIGIWCVTDRATGETGHRGAAAPAGRRGRHQLGPDCTRRHARG